ncbi:putative opsin 1 [Phaeomoniella chlamydospora]|uniref:Putative opsin 1 n=1 Tax=Phaeomoniella chlamydospora TaxID=158046 RepID=A0A0G2DXR2_PHACM|nr:putative opsin 1 [Phaeomoniella chlamydospora]
MIVDPNVFATGTVVAPVTSSVAPIPTVIPGSPPIYETASETGHRTLWVVVVLMGLSSLAFYGMALRVPAQKRLFHILTAFITTFAFLSYFALATGDGITYHHFVKTESHKHGLPDTYQDIYRQVYWARYVDWSITTPLLLLDLSLLAGLSGANILVAVVADLIMILTGLFAAFGSHKGQRWGWYAWACIAFLVIVYQIGFNGRKSVAGKNNKTKAFVISISTFTLVLWALYPIIWAIADGARIINVNSEIIAYAVLDLLAKPVFGFWLLLTHDKMTFDSPTFGGFWAEGFGQEGTIRVGDDDEGA